MGLFFSEKTESQVAPPEFSEEERDFVIAQIKHEFEQNPDLIYKEAGSLVRDASAEPEADSQLFIMCRIFKNPQGQLIAVSDTVLGSGAYGTVYLAQNLDTNEFCVAKQQAMDITEEIDNFNGIYSDEYIDQTFVVRPKPNVNIWIGFMPYFPGVTCDEVVCGCKLEPNTFTDLSFITKTAKLANEKRIAAIRAEQKAHTEARIAKPQVRSDSVVTKPLSEEDKRANRALILNNHPMRADIDDAVMGMSHEELTQYDFAEYFQDLFERVGDSLEDKNLALEAAELEFARMLKVKQKFDQQNRNPIVGVLPANAKMTDLLDNLQVAVKVLANYTSRVKVAHDGGYIFRDLKAENSIVNGAGNVFLIDAAAVKRLPLGSNSIIEEAITPDCTEFYLSHVQQESIKHNKIYYTALFMSHLRKDPAFAGRKASVAEVSYLNKGPKKHSYHKKGDAYALGITLQRILLKIAGIPYDEANLPQSFENPKNELAVELLNRALEIVISLKSEARSENSSVEPELEQFNELLDVVKSVNNFDRSKSLFARLASRINGDTETENDKLWRAASSIFVAMIKDVESEKVDYNYKKVTAPGIAEITRSKSNVFIQLPVLSPEDIDQGSKVDPVFVMLENLNPGSKVTIGNCATTPEVALKLYTRAQELGLRPEYGVKDCTYDAVQRYQTDRRSSIASSL